MNTAATTEREQYKVRWKNKKNLRIESLLRKSKWQELPKKIKLKYQTYGEYVGIKTSVRLGGKMVQIETSVYVRISGTGGYSVFMQGACGWLSTYNIERAFRMSEASRAAKKVTSGTIVVLPELGSLQVVMKHGAQRTKYLGVTSYREYTLVMEAVIDAVYSQILKPKKVKPILQMIQGWSISSWAVPMLMARLGGKQTLGIMIDPPAIHKTVWQVVSNFARSGILGVASHNEKELKLYEQGYLRTEYSTNKPLEGSNSLDTPGFTARERNWISPVEKLFLRFGVNDFFASVWGERMMQKFVTLLTTKRNPSYSELFNGKKLIIEVGARSPLSDFLLPPAVWKKFNAEYANGKSSAMKLLEEKLAKRIDNMVTRGDINVIVTYDDHRASQILSSATLRRYTAIFGQLK